MKVSFLLLLLLPVLSGAASSLEFVPVPGTEAQGVIPMPGGNVAFYGAATPSGCIIGPPGSCYQTETPLLSILDVSGAQIAALSSSALGSGNSSIAAAAIDASGDIWIAGSTDSDDFPLVHPLFSQKVDYNQAGFVAKLDPTLNILFSTFLDNQQNDQQTIASVSSPAAIAVDSAGNAYVAGSTVNPGFPTTGPIFGAGAPSPIGVYTFVSKISPDGSSVLYSRLLGGHGSLCVGGSSCLFYVVYGRPSAIAVDANGNLTVAGTTNATNFPVTANVYQTGGGAFVSRISADGSQLIWSTNIGAAMPVGYLSPFSSAQSIALDAAGNVYIAGSAPGPVATTPNALQATVPASPTLAYSGFAAKLSPNATQLLFATNLGGTNGATLAGLALDPSGNVWIAGHTSSPDFPGLTNTPPGGVDFALELNSGATALQQIFPLVPATVTQPPAFDTNADLLLPATAGNLLRMDPSTALSAPEVFAITNAAVPRATAGLAIGEIVAIYGTGLGPSPAIVGEPDDNGLYPKQLGGVTVEFETTTPTVSRVAAPLLYVGPDQINLQVPFSLNGATNVVVTTPTGTLPAIPLQQIGSIGIFGVLNQDGSLNTASNPAETGSIVSLYLTGLGQPEYGAQDGAISTSADSAFQYSMEVVWQSSAVPGEASVYPLTLWYAGTAPDLINGLDQVNVQLPQGVQNPVLTVQRLYPAGGCQTAGCYTPATSNQVVVYAR